MVSLSSQQPNSATQFIELTGCSAHVRAVRLQVMELGQLMIPVLIYGESGTGKEIVAKLVHRHSPRSQKPFMAINCAALPPSLIESELFGHVQGAFTGASKTKHGFFEVACGGTMFLDEIGDLPLDLQAKLLRVLDKGEFNRVGETQARTADVRIVSATNRDLDAMMQSGLFRSDLYFRLKGGCIALEPLRNRREDIGPLIDYYIGKTHTLSREAMELLTGYGWPGNIRELSMVCAAIKGRSAGSQITGDVVRTSLGNKGPGVGSLGSYHESKARFIHDFDREYFSAILKQNGGNITRAAMQAGMDRKNFRQRMKLAGLHDQTN
jgi:two-component system response regulator HydG